MAATAAAGAAAGVSALGVLGAATGLFSFGMGIANSIKQKDAESRARFKSEKMMAEANAIATKNFSEEVQIPLTPYELQFRANAALTQQSLTALQEGSSRTLAAGVGKVGGAQVATNEKTKSAMEQALYENDLMKAQAAQKINNDLVDIEVGGAADQSMMARDAATRQGSAIASAAGGLNAAAKAGNALIPLYQKNRKDRLGNKVTGALGNQSGTEFLGEGGQALSDAELMERVQGLPEFQGKKPKRKDIMNIVKSIKDKTFDMSRLGGTNANAMANPLTDSVPNTFTNMTGSASTRFVEKGDFISLDNISLGYTLPKMLMDKIRVDNFRVFVQAQNIWLISDYKGINPEMETSGVDINGTPRSKVVSVGVNVSL